MKKLPLGDYTFSEIIKGGFLYADKTRYIYDLLDEGYKTYFLSRPRRFGKTLLLHTLDRLFAGDREEFENLWIHGSDYNFEKHPVVMLTLSMDSDSPEIFREGLISALAKIAGSYNLDIPEMEPSEYFGELLAELHKATGKTAVVLIDEYDAPVTRNMGDLKLAQANAEILHNFLATLKDLSVAPSVFFTFVTGITRFALTTESGPNYLVDISMDPKYAGICGFTLDEFGPLFKDRMAPTLAALRAANLPSLPADADELKEIIFGWYDGYNWGGETRVLNPFSILNFFENNKFDDYWVQSGRPGHLTAMIEANPEAFLAPKLESYTSEELRKTELTGLQPAPVLFHSGYLTLDKVVKTLAVNPNTKKRQFVNTYSFRQPNFEVSHNYLNSLFSIIFEISSAEDLSKKAEELRKAVLARDAEKTAAFFQGYLSRVSCRQRPSGEKTFHAFVQMILISLGFKVFTEMPGDEGRLDLVFELPGDVYVIAELKYVPEKSKSKLTEAETDIALASAAEVELEPETVHKALAAAVLREFPSGDQRLSDIINRSGLTKSERNERLAVEARRLLPKSRIDQILADLAKKILPKKIIEDTIKDMIAESAPSHEQIEIDLLDAANQAINQINRNDYNSIVGDMAKEIIDLGLAAYGHFKPVKAVFGPDRP